MPRSLLALPFVLLSVAASAQDGPSFDCDDAGTRTELAICADPQLARLEMMMFEAYQRLVDAIGQREARAIADEFLVRRQACEGDAACTTDRLLISMEAFNQRAGRTTDLARVEAILRGAPEIAQAPPPVAEAPPMVAAEPAPPSVVEPEPEAAEAPPLVATEPELAAIPSAAPAPGIPLAAQAPWPVEDPPSSEELSAALDDAALASSDGAEEAAPAAAATDPDGPASFETPVSWAYMDLTREQRTALQQRLAQAGFYEGATTGSWTNATEAALEAVAEAEGGGSFDLSTQTGASLLLDYVGSEAFASSFGVESAVAPDVAEPLAATDW